MFIASDAKNVYPVEIINIFEAVLLGKRCEERNTIELMGLIHMEVYLGDIKPIMH